MATTPRLKNTLLFTALAAGASVVLPHALSNGQRDLSPDIIFLPSDVLEVTASDGTAVTLKNNGAVPISGALLVEAWHTIERAFGDVEDTDLPVKPYIVVSDAGGAVVPQLTNARVRANGVAYAATNASVSRNSDGRYHVDFLTPFPSDVAVTALICQDLSANFNNWRIYAYNITPAGFDLGIDEASDGWDPQDAEWSFIAEASIADI